MEMGFFIIITIWMIIIKNFGEKQNYDDKIRKWNDPVPELKFTARLLTLTKRNFNVQVWFFSNIQIHSHTPTSQYNWEREKFIK